MRNSNNMQIEYHSFDIEHNINESEELDLQDILSDVLAINAAIDKKIAEKKIANTLKLKNYADDKMIDVISVMDIGSNFVDETVNSYNMRADSENLQFQASLIRKCLD